jgi:hypothetical protein
VRGGEYMQSMQQANINQFTARKLAQAAVLMACIPELLCLNLERVTVCPDWGISFLFLVPTGKFRIVTSPSHYHFFLQPVPFIIYSSQKNTRHYLMCYRAVCCSGNALDLYSGGARFESQPGNRLS